MEKWPPVYDASYHPDPDSEYWFTEIETMDPEEREQTIILPKLQEQIDVIGVSSLGGAHLSLGSLLMQKAQQKGFKDELVFLIGGVFSPEDADELVKIGFDGVYPPGSTRETIINGLKAALAEKQAGDSS